MVKEGEGVCEASMPEVPWADTPEVSKHFEFAKVDFIGFLMAFQWCSMMFIGFQWSFNVSLLFNGLRWSSSCCSSLFTCFESFLTGFVMLFITISDGFWGRQSRLSRPRPTAMPARRSSSSISASSTS